MIVFQPVADIFITPRFDMLVFLCVRLTDVCYDVYTCVGSVVCGSFNRYCQGFKIQILVFGYYGTKLGSTQKYDTVIYCNNMLLGDTTQQAYEF